MYAWVLVDSNENVCTYTRAKSQSTLQSICSASIQPTVNGSSGLTTISYTVTPSSLSQYSEHADSQTHTSIPQLHKLKYIYTTAKQYFWCATNCTVHFEVKYFKKQYFKKQAKSGINAAAADLSRYVDVKGKVFIV